MAAVEERGCLCTDQRHFKSLHTFYRYYALLVLKTLHSVKHILNEEECRSVGKAGDCWRELVVVIAVKTPGAVKETLGVLEKYKGRIWHDGTAKEIKMLSELYQEKLVTGDEVKRMKEGVFLSDRVVLVQCNKPQELMTRTANVLDKYEYYEEASLLRALNDLFTRHLLTAEMCSEVAGKGRWQWEEHLAPVLLTKPGEVVQEVCQVLAKYGCRAKKELKMLSKLYQQKLVTEDEVKRKKKEKGDLSDEVVFVQYTKPPEVVARTAALLEEYQCYTGAKQLRVLNELFTRYLLTAAECSEVVRRGRMLWTDHLAQVLSTKPARVVQEACSVLEKHGCSVNKELKMLSELYQEKLVTEDELERMKGKGGLLSDGLVYLQCTKPSEMVARTVKLLDKNQHNVSARQLRVLNELFTRNLLTAEECSEVARRGRTLWKDHLAQVLSTKPARVVQEACPVLEKHGCSVNKELKILNALFTRLLLTAEECSEVTRRRRTLWKDHLAQVLSTKPAGVVQEACQVLEKHGCSVEKLKILNELFTRHLLTAEECSEVTREDHLYQALSTKPVEVVQEACQVLLEHGCSVKKLKTLNELFSRHLLAAEECSEVARKGKRHRRWEYYLVQVLSTKPAELVQEACQVLEKHGYPEKEELKALNELFTRHLLTAEECSHMARKGRRHRMGNIFVMRNEDYLTQVLTKPAEVVQEACEVLEKHGCRVKKELKMLSELYQEKLVTEDEVKRMKGGRLSDRVVRAHCTKPLKVVARTTNVLDKYGHNEDARQLRALNELFTRHLLTAEECYAMLARKKRRWEDHLTEVLLTKPAEVVQEACQMLEKHGYPVKKELKMLLELYQEKLVTEDVVKWMKGERGHLSDRVVHVQCTKTPEVVARTTNVLDKYEHNKEARLLRALSELFTRHLLTAEECSEVARKREWEWEDRLNQVLLAKPAEVVPEACQVIEKHGCSVKKLQSLNELFTRHLLTAEECSEVARNGSRWENHLNQVLLTKPAEVVQDACQVLKKHGCFVNKELKTLNALFTRHLLTAEEFSRVARDGRRWEDHLAQALKTKPAELLQEACQVLEKHGCPVKKELKRLSELYQKLLTEDVVKWMKGERRSLSDRVVQCTKPAEEVAKTANLLDTYGHNVAARLLRVLNELFTRHLLTAEECSEVASEDHLNQVLSTKPVEVVQEACQVLLEHGCSVKKLKTLNELFTRHLLAAKECSEVARRKWWEWEDHLKQVLLTKHAKVMQKACQVLEKNGCRTNKELKMALPTGPAFPGPPQQTPVRDAGAATPLPTATPPPPDTADIVEALNNQLDARWRLFGTFLRVDYQTMNIIETSTRGKPNDCMLDLLGRWTSNQAGTGTLTRTWQTVMEAVRKTGFPVIAENLAHKHGLTLSQ